MLLAPLVSAEHFGFFPAAGLRSFQNSLFFYLHILSGKTV